MQLGSSVSVVNTTNFILLFWYFSTKYSKSCLNQHLVNGFLDLHVNCPEYDGAVHVRLIQRLEYVAEMTSHCPEILKKGRFKVGDLCIFT